MKDTLIYSNQGFITHNQSAEIAQPGESPCDFPPMLVALPDFWRLLTANFAVSAVRDQKADSPPSQSGPQFVQIMSLITDKALKSALWAPPTLANGLQGLFCQPYFRGRCRGNGKSSANRNNPPDYITHQPNLLLDAGQLLWPPKSPPGLRH